MIGATILAPCHIVNSLWPSDAIWHQRSWSTLVQVMAYCLTAPSHQRSWSTLAQLNQWFVAWQRQAITGTNVLYHQRCSVEFTWEQFHKWINLIHNICSDITLPKLLPHLSGANELTHWGRDKMDAISQTTFLSAFSCMKMLEFRFGFHWSLFLRVQLTIFQHWCR